MTDATPETPGTRYTIRPTAALLTPPGIRLPPATYGIPSRRHPQCGVPLAPALATLYETFAAPRPRTIVGCPCCIDRKDIGTLLRTPLRALTSRQLGSYASSLFHTVGEVDDFRYFLPRILEIVATEPHWWPSPEVALEKLRLGGWSDWPPAERAAIEAVLMAMFEDALIDPDPFAFHIDELLCGLARAGQPLAPYLAALEAPGHETALHAVVARRWDGKLGRLVAEAGNFWEDAPQGVAAMTAFLAAYEGQAMDWVAEEYRRADRIP